MAMPATEKELSDFIMKIILEMALLKKPEEQMALLLYAHINDMRDFRASVDNRFRIVDNKLTNLDSDVKQLDTDVKKLDADVKTIQETMVTKEEFRAEINAMKETMVTKEEFRAEINTIKETMITKDFWEVEKTRLITGIGQEMMRIIKEDRKVSVT